MSDLDQMIETRGYRNRSEAIRDLARAGIQQALEDAGQRRDCVGALVYVYDHSARDLAKRLLHSFHDYHDISTATLHVHLDHESCMEVTILKGCTADVQKVADHVIAERGCGTVVWLRYRLSCAASSIPIPGACRTSFTRSRQS
jgi:CopG family transcriptional regulator, nickel-responsive regulator